MIIFYADDDKEDRDLFSQVVKQINPSFVVVEAENGFEALKLLSQRQANKPDIIFLDINMPKMDGFETLIEIRKDKRYLQTRIIMYSTGILPKMQGAYKAFNAQFLKKHGRIEDIEESIRRVITNQP